ncbi:hypothetical protein HIM_02711 [Hirsutella minnesotensis 3608]|nr:hypothetical protein HIM_02711 [Hirsutella minnesotensis 3608]
MPINYEQGRTRIRQVQVRPRQVLDVLRLGGLMGYGKAAEFVQHARLGGEQRQLVEPWLRAMARAHRDRYA